MNNTDTTLTISIVGKNNHVYASNSGKGNVLLDYIELYQPGDFIRIESGRFPIELSIRIDKKIPEANIWLTSSLMEFPVHLEEVDKVYAPGTFEPDSRMLYAAVTRPEISAQYRNLSFNPIDKHEDSTYYPHCTATHESDNHDPRFVARNAINGVVVPYGHWGWPYTSWGNDRNPDAEIKIEFGRPVVADKVLINLRADFPHDNWWRQAKLVFSDASTGQITLNKSGNVQDFSFTPRVISWIKMTNLIQCEDDPSPFPALTQWAVYGIVLQ